MQSTGTQAIERRRNGRNDRMKTIEMFIEIVPDAAAGRTKMVSNMELYRNRVIVCPVGSLYYVYT